MLQEQEARRALHGTVNCVLTILLAEERSDELAHILHEYRSLIRTQLHDHLSTQCLELLILRGSASLIASLVAACERCRGVKRCVLQPL